MTAVKIKQVSDTLVTVTLTFDLPGLKGETIARYESAYKVYSDGELEVLNKYTALGISLPEIPRMGMNLQLAREYENMKWFGRGPQENYWDRNSGALIGLYGGKVKDQSPHHTSACP